MYNKIRVHLTNFREYARQARNCRLCPGSLPQPIDENKHDEILAEVPLQETNIQVEPFVNRYSRNHAREQEDLQPNQVQDQGDAQRGNKNLGYPVTRTVTTARSKMFNSSAEIIRTTNPEFHYVKFVLYPIERNSGNIQFIILS